MKTKSKMIIIIVAFALLLIVASTVGAYAYIRTQKDAEFQTKVGHAEIVSVENSTTENKIAIGDGSLKSANIKINLDCNIDAVIRVKISPRYFDNFDRVSVLPNNVIYNFDNTAGNWIADSNNMCFYLNSSVKNLDSVNFINSVSFSTTNIENYENCTLDFIVEVDILQTAGIDYNNHPWKDNAPAEWLETVKNI